MRLLGLLFSFKGRINRTQYWFGSLGVSVGALVLMGAVWVAAGPMPGGDKMQMVQSAIAAVLLMGLVGAVAGSAGAALQVKRFHDRGQSGLLSLLPWLPLAAIGVTLLTSAISGASTAQIGASIQLYVLALWAINFFFFINLGCLAGTPGPNKYGDPPGGASATPRTPAASVSAPAKARPTSAALASAEAAMERAIQDRSRKSAAQPAPQPVLASPAPTFAAAPRAFGKRAAS